jgi:hypothetical protein
MVEDPLMYIKKMEADKMHDTATNPAELEKIRLLIQNIQE